MFFIPPAVLAGEPPINIKIIEINFVAVVSTFVFIVVNPAVLNVVE